MAFLEVRDLRKNFGGTEVLKGVSFSLDQGKVLAVIGSSGNGKTTLLRCLNGLETADGGCVIVDGTATVFGGDSSVSCVAGVENVAGVESVAAKTGVESAGAAKKAAKKAANAANAANAAKIKAENRDFTMVFQNFQLFPQYTALRNVSLAADLCELGALKGEKLPRKEKSAKKKQIRAKNAENARLLLEKVGLAEKLGAYPCELSGGQQQRVAIARALALQPKILCFDEPTSALDPHLTGEISALIGELKAEGRTMIVVTHEMEFARSVADEILFLHEGRAEESGSASAAFENPKSELFKAFVDGGKNK